MKAKLTIVAGLVALFSTAFISSQAQSNSPAIKVLPTSSEGIVKLLVVGAQHEPVEVRFYNREGLVDTDEIRWSMTPGFNKKYDISKVFDPGFAMEISSGGTSVTYKMTRFGSKLTPVLTKSTQEYPIVARKN